jgi:hypothetical protein
VNAEQPEKPCGACTQCLIRPGEDGPHIRELVGWVGEGVQACLRGAQALGDHGRPRPADHGYDHHAEQEQ